MNNKHMPPRRQRDPRQVNIAIGMCIGLVIGALGMLLCTQLGYDSYTTICLIVCMFIGGAAGSFVKRK